MNRFPTADRRNRRLLGRARRPAMSSDAILAEMPRQLRQMHCLGGGGFSTNPTTSKQDKWNDEGGKLATKKHIHCRGHVRQHAMIWDDLVSIVRLGMMRMERKKLPVEKFGKTPSARYQHHNSHSTITSSSSIDRPHHSAPTQLSDDEIPSEVYDMMSPPRITRMALCFDSNNGCESLTLAFGSVSQSLSEAMDPTAIRRMPFSFDRGNNGCDSITNCDDAPTYVSDDDDKETSSLEYSDDNSDVERAIVASAAIPHSISYLDSVTPMLCTICLDCTDSSNIATVSGCEHIFCFKCIDRWAERKNECPLCKKSFHWVSSQRRVRWY